MTLTQLSSYRYSVPIQWVGLRPSQVERLKKDLPEEVFQSLSSANIAICPRKGFPSFMGHTFSIVLYGHLHDLLLLSSRMNDGLSAADHPLIP